MDAADDGDTARRAAGREGIQRIFREANAQSQAPASTCGMGGEELMPL